MTLTQRVVSFMGAVQAVYPNQQVKAVTLPLGGRDVSYCSRSAADNYQLESLRSLVDIEGYSLESVGKFRIDQQQLGIFIF